MTAADAEPFAPMDPLDMARNAAAGVQRVAAWQADPDPDKRLQALITHAGKLGMDSAIVAACMALVSIAADVRRLADRAP